VNTTESNAMLLCGACGAAVDDLAENGDVCGECRKGFYDQADLDLLGVTAADARSALHHEATDPWATATVKAEWLDRVPTTLLQLVADLDDQLRPVVEDPWADGKPKTQARVKDASIAQVREQTNIAEVISERVTLRPAGGGNLKGLCPFHEERTPSFNVRPQVGAYHCFGCGVGGDAIDFVMRSRQVSFAEAVALLAAHLGLPVEYVNGIGDPWATGQAPPF